MLHDQIPGAFLLDIVEGGEKADVPYWRPLLERFVHGPAFPEMTMEQFDLYETIDWQLSDGLDRSVLPDDLGDFSPIPARLLQGTQLPDDAHTMGHDPAKESDGLILLISSSRISSLALSSAYPWKSLLK